MRDEYPSALMNTGRRLRAGRMVLQALGRAWLWTSAIAAPALLAHHLWCCDPPRRAVQGVASREPAARSASATPVFAVMSEGEAHPARKSAEVAGTIASAEVLVRPMLDAGIPGAAGADELAKTWAALGFAHLKTGRRQEAMLAFERSIVLCDEPYDFVCFLTDEVPELALWLLGLGESRGRPRAEDLTQLARILRGHDRRTEALSLLQRALALKPEAADPLYELIDLDPDMAIQAVDAWVAAHPDAADDIIRLAQDLRDANRPEAAVRLATVAALGAKGDQRYINSAMSLVEIAPGAALPALQWLAGEHPDNIAVLRCLAHAYDEAGFHADAAAALRCAIKISGEPHEDDLRTLVKLDPHGAVEVLERLPREVATDADNAGLLGLAFKALGRTDEARAAILQAIALRPSSDEWPVALAAIDPTAALDAIEAQIRRRSGSSSEDEAWGNLGNVYEAIGRPGQALSAYQRAAELDPNDGEWDRAVARLTGGPVEEEQEEEQEEEH